MRYHDDLDLNSELYLDFLRYLTANYPRSDYKLLILETLISYKQMDADEDPTFDMSKYDLCWANKIWDLFIENNYRVFNFRKTCWEIAEKFTYGEKDDSEYDELIDEFTNLFSIIREHDFDLYELINFVKLQCFRSLECNDDAIFEYCRYVSETFKYQFLLSEFNRIVKPLEIKTGQLDFEIKTDKKVYSTFVR